MTEKTTRAREADATRSWWTRPGVQRDREAFRTERERQQARMNGDTAAARAIAAIAAERYQSEYGGGRRAVFTGLATKWSAR